jgi:hypothetical protein
VVGRNGARSHFLAEILAVVLWRDVPLGMPETCRKTHITLRIENSTQTLNEVELNFYFKNIKKT